MYLVSIYFDDKTEKHIRGFIKQVARKTGNTYMIDENVPPHITISAIESKNEEQLKAALEERIPKLKSGSLTFASVAVFLPGVIYLAPVLNEYLQQLSCEVNEQLAKEEQTKIRENYTLFNWMPHTTIGKKLSKEEMKLAFETLQNSFGMFEGTVTKIGLAKTNPYQDIKVWELN